MTHGMRWLASEFDYRNSRPTKRQGSRPIAEILADPQHEVGCGCPLDAISELSGLQRQLLQEGDWHFVGRALLRKRDPEEAPEHGHTFDIDSSDATNAFTVWLESYRKILTDPLAFDWLMSKRDHLLEMFKAGEDLALQNSEGGILDIADRNGSYVTLGPDSLSSADEDDFFSTAVEEGLLGESSEDTNYILRQIRRPRDSYRMVENPSISPLTEAKERRITSFTLTLEEIGKLGTYQRMVDARAKNIIEEVEKFFDRLRPAYYEDQKIWQAWSETRKAEDRNLYEQGLISRGFDPETINKKLWACFDRKNIPVNDIYQTDGSFVKTIYGPVDMEWVNEHRLNVVSQGMVTPSLWDQGRAKAFTALNLTKEQWNKVYTKAWDKLKMVIYAYAKVAKSDGELQVVRMALGKYSRRFGKEFVREVASSLWNK